MRGNTLWSNLQPKMLLATWVLPAIGGHYDHSRKNALA